MKKEAEKLHIPFLGNIPLNKKIRKQSDDGKPCIVDDPKGDISKIFISIAKNLDHSLKN